MSAGHQRYAELLVQILITFSMASEQNVPCDKIGMTVVLHF